MVQIFCYRLGSFYANLGSPFFFLIQFCRHIIINHSILHFSPMYFIYSYRRYSEPNNTSSSSSCESQSSCLSGNVHRWINFHAILSLFLSLSFWKQFGSISSSVCVFSDRHCIATLFPLGDVWTYFSSQVKLASINASKL